MQLTLITCLSPSLPEDLFRRIADRIRAATGLATHLLFETRISGPLEGDAEPFMRQAIAAALLSMERTELEPFGFLGFAHADEEAYVNAVAGAGVGLA